MTPPPDAHPDAHSDARQEIAYFMRRLYRQGLTTTSGGNISMRVDAETIAITPSALDKARIRANQVGLMRTDGTNLTPELRPSIETRMHLELYAARVGVGAIVHAHPVTASAFTAAATPIDCTLLVESCAILGTPVVAPYAPMGTPELARRVAEAARDADCILMRNHGVVSLGGDLLEAFDRMELLEAAARMTVVARGLDGVTPLTAAQREEIRKA